MYPKLWRKVHFLPAKREPRWMLAVPPKTLVGHKSLSEKSQMKTTSPRCSGQRGALSLPMGYWGSSALVNKPSRKKRSTYSLAMGDGRFSV